MKKLIFAAFAVSSVAVFATSIESSNIVGYATTADEIKANSFTLGTAPFASVTKEGFVTGNEMVQSSAPAVSYDDRETSGAQIQVWNGSGYDVYYYINDAGDAMNETGWADGSGYVTTKEYACGTGFWFKYPTEASTFTLSGQVLNRDSVTKDVALNKFELIGNPFPTSLYLTKVTTTVPAVSYDNRETDGVQLQVWNGTGYNVYYYINDAGDDMNETGWADGSGYVMEAVAADATKGMWCKSPKSAGTITFAK